MSHSSVSFCPATEHDYLFYIEMGPEARCWGKDLGWCKWHDWLSLKTLSLITNSSLKVQVCKASLRFFTFEAPPPIKKKKKWQQYCILSPIHVVLFANQRVGTTDDHFHRVMLTNKVINAVSVSFGFSQFYTDWSFKQITSGVPAECTQVTAERAFINPVMSHLTIEMNFAWGAFKSVFEPHTVFLEK